VLQEWTWEWYGWLTVPLVPFWHFIGASDTGCLFALLWWSRFPDAGPGGKCDKSFYKKWLPVRVKHVSFLACLWGSIWLLGSWGMGRSLGEGWEFFWHIGLGAEIVVEYREVGEGRLLKTSTLNCKLLYKRYLISSLSIVKNYIHGNNKTLQVKRIVKAIEIYDNTVKTIEFESSAFSESIVHCRKNVPNIPTVPIIELY